MLQYWLLKAIIHLFLYLTQIIPVIISLLGYFFSHTDFSSIVEYTRTRFKILMRVDRASNCFNFGSTHLIAQ